VNGVTCPRVAYLLLSHKNPRQVEALVSRVLELSPKGQVVVHHDLTANEMPWNGQPPSRVHLVERKRIAWGDWSIVDATLRMARFALDRLHADWLVVLSGEHWPVVDLARWEPTLGQSGSDALTPSIRLPGRMQFGQQELDGNRFLARCAHKWFTVKRPRSKVAQKALVGLSKCSLLAHPLFKLEFSLRNDAWFVGTFRARGPVRNWALYKGSQWIAISAQAALAVLTADPDVTAWFERSHIADESYIQTIVHHSDSLVTSDQIVTFVPAEPTRPTREWMLLKLRDLPEVWASDAAFARKVDLSLYPEVISTINQCVDQQRLEVCAT
jgi:Core-2/I-Branching enzyme